MLLSLVRWKRSLIFLFLTFLILAAFLIYQTGLYHKAHIPHFATEPPPPPPKPLHIPPPEPRPPIVDNFPAAASAKGPSDLPSIPPWNTPPNPHVNETTPLFIGFTRNWLLLQQVVVSYVTAGWPPSDIYIVENTGTMRSNRDGLLTLQNPFYLDYHRLTKVLGVNIISTPTLLTFAQLQNFYVYTALEKGWEHYFWSHMDTIAVSDEEYDVEPYQSLYMRAVYVMRETMRPEYGPLAARWFNYDMLSLVRTKAFVDVGGWDTMISFYLTDCDMHERLWMRNFKIENAQAGRLWDVSTSLEDLAILYHRETKKANLKRADTDTPTAKDSISAATRNSSAYHDLIGILDEMQHHKHGDTSGRNTWQARQQGGKGEPFYRDPGGFERAIAMTIEHGRRVFGEKWGRGECNLRDVGLVEEDAWRVMLEWEKPEVQEQARKDEKKAAEMKQKEKGKGSE